MNKHDKFHARKSDGKDTEDHQNKAWQGFKKYEKFIDNDVQTPVLQKKDLAQRGLAPKKHFNLKDNSSEDTVHPEKEVRPEPL